MGDGRWIEVVPQRGACRLDLARTALHAGDRSVHQIASDLGYANPLRFSGQFRSLVGLSPSA